MRIIDYRVQRNVNRESSKSQNIRLFLNFENELSVQHGNEESRLKKNDVLLVNADSEIVLNGKNVLFVCFSIDYMAFKEAFSGKRFRFFCNSTIESNDNYPILVRMLEQLLRCSYEGSIFTEASMKQLSYEIMIFLVTNFSIGEIEERNVEAADHLIDYIEQNYQKELSLKQISEDFHMTPQYFSKYFKQNIGTNYYKYLSAVRLEHAVELLKNSEGNLLHIALQSGFPNAESFYRYFQEAYGETPQEYRAKYRVKIGKRREEQQCALEEALQHIGIEPEKETDAGKMLIIKGKERKEFVRFWAEIVNLNSFSLLQDAEVREQMKELQSFIHYRYARIPLEKTEPAEDESFFVEEQGIDYLQTLGLRIWIVIDFRLVEKKSSISTYLHQMLSHLANRYSVDTVRQWRFELAYNTVFSEEKAQEYWKMFQSVQSVLSHFGCKALIGAGLSVGNVEGIRQFYRFRPTSWKKMPLQTFQSEPFTYLNNENGETFRRTTDGSYLLNRILSLRQNIPEFREESRELYITGWSDNIFSHNILNDSCFRGAEVIKNVIDCMDYVRALAPKMPLDLMDRSNLQGGILFGADGLISKHGIKKPSFYGYSFLSHIGDRYITKDENSVVFSDAPNYQIICHNCKRLSYRYYLDEQKLLYSRFDEYFDDLASLRLHYELLDIEDGEYIIKTRIMTPESGSVQDELNRMVWQEGIYVHPNDVNYLKQIATPQIRIEKISVRDGRANISIDLPANAFAHIHIIYQF